MDGTRIIDLTVGDITSIVHGVLVGAALGLAVTAAAVIFARAVTVVILKLWERIKK